MRLRERERELERNPEEEDEDQEPGGDEGEDEKHFSSSSTSSDSLGARSREIIRRSRLCRSITAPFCGPLVRDQLRGGKGDEDQRLVGARGGGEIVCSAICRK